MTDDDVVEAVGGLADGHRPGGGWDAVLRRVERRRRRRRHARCTAVGAAAVVVALAVALPLSLVGGGGGRRVTTVPGPAAGPVPSTDLVTLDGTSVRVVSAATGAVVRRVALRPALPSSPVSLTVAPGGRTAYVSVIAGASCSSSLLVEVDLITGATRQVGAGADPAISPDGTRLAYASGCGGDAQVAVRDLVTGATRSWVLPRAVVVRGLVDELITGLSWAPDGQHLVIGETFSAPSGIQILDTAEPVGATNPVTVPRRVGGFTSPIFLPDGRLVAIRPRCFGAVGCPAANPDGGVGDPVDIIDPVTGAVTSSPLPAGAPGPSLSSEILTDPSGTRLAVLGDAPSGEGLYVLAGGRARLIASAVGVAAWLPAR